jgi:ATP-binding cassette subfamily C protein
MRAEPLQELQVRNLTYRYPNSSNGITDINLTLRRGSLTVITGPVGAGKTTLLRVLLGLLPKQAGQILWNGAEVTNPASFFIPPYAAYTPQIPQLFSASLRDNLLLGLEDRIAPASVEQAVTTAVFDKDLAAMPNGLGTLVGTKGLRLSGGQKQRAAAVRMLLRQPELLVFDDLSSALDIETEQQLWERLFQGRGKWTNRSEPEEGNRKTASTHEDLSLLPIRASNPLASVHSSTYQPTCLVVSHRPAVLQRADWVIVLDAGRIRFSGQPTHLQDQQDQLKE